MKPKSPSTKRGAAAPKKSKAMTAKEYTAAVNDILRKTAAKDNASHQRGESLFGAEHVDLPEFMLKTYQDMGFTPEQAIAEMDADGETEGFAEAMAS